MVRPSVPPFRLLLRLLPWPALFGVLAESVLDGDRFPFERPFLLALPRCWRWASLAFSLSGRAGGLQEEGGSRGLPSAAQ